jgi:hypothetical protein
VTGEEILRLTEEQEALFAVVREEWTAIALGTGPADRQSAERGVADAYRAAGLEPPRLVLWFDSPFSGAVGSCLLAELGEQVGPYVAEQVWVAVEWQARREVGDQLRRQVGARADDWLWEQVRTHVDVPVWRAVLWGRHTVEDEILDQIDAWLEAQIGGQDGGQVSRAVGTIWDVIRSQTGTKIEPDVWNLDWYWNGDHLERAVYGQHEAARLAALDAIARLGGHKCERLTGLTAVARNAGWWWPFREAAVLTERPSYLSRDDQGRLHEPTGPAVRYPDGFAVHVLHGVRVRRPGP